MEEQKGLKDREKTGGEEGEVFDRENAEPFLILANLLELMSAITKLEEFSYDFNIQNLSRAFTIFKK